MKDRTKKWMAVAGCLVLCGVLVTLITSRFQTAPVIDAPLPPDSSQTGGVTVDAELPKAPASGPVVEIQPNLAPVESTPAAMPDMSGTEQALQLDPVRPVEPEDTALTDPETPPAPPQAPAPGGGNGGGGLPGFGNVPEGGANQAVPGGELYENGNKIGVMD